MEPTNREQRRHPEQLERLEREGAEAHTDPPKNPGGGDERHRPRAGRLQRPRQVERPRQEDRRQVEPVRETARCGARPVTLARG